MSAAEVLELAAPKLYYSDESVTIYHGDIRGGIPEIEGTVAVSVGSPPYNVGIEYDQHNDAMDWDEYGRLALGVSSAVAEALVDGGRSWVNVAPVVQEEPGGAGRNGDGPGRAQKARQNLIQIWSGAAEAAGLAPADMIAWCSQRGSGTAWGSYEMPSAPNVRGDWEAILWYFKGEFARKPPAGMEGWRDKIGGWPALVSNVWQIRPETTRDGHPVPYPVELAQRCIRLSSWPGETVLDPFVGSGSTLLAARALGRKSIGVEVSERYCEQAANRLAQGGFDFGGAA